METKENNPPKLYGLIILILGLLVISAGGGLIFLSLDDNEEKPNNNSNQNNEDIITLDINDELVVKLYSYIDKEYSNTHYVNQTELSYYPYRDEKVTYDKLSKDYVTRIVMNGIDSNTKDISFAFDGTGANTEENLLYVNIPISVFNSTLKERYGNVSDFKADDLKKVLDENLMHTNDFEVDDRFIGSLVCGPKHYAFSSKEIGLIGNDIVCAEIRGGGTIVRSWNYTEIIMVEKDDSNIYIYDKFMARRDDMYYFSSTEGIVDTTGGETESSAPLETIEKYIDKLHTYKHTFTKDDNDNYYYVSSEMVK